jgi:CheY-like chemotaxis protein
VSYVASPHLESGSPQRRVFFQNVRNVAPSPAAFRPLARVLVSDDDPDIRQLYASLLGEHGFEYIGAPAGDGSATLELARQARPHLLITDVNKPGLDGHSLRAAMRADSRTAHIPVLMVTAMEPWSEGRRAAESPLDDYFLKPFAFETLLYRVVAMLALDAAGHDRLVERARRLPCFEHFHPVTGLPCLHTLAGALPALTAQPGWAAVSVTLAGFPGLVRRFGRHGAEGLLARLGGIARLVAGDGLMVAHPGFDPQIAVVGPAERVVLAAARIVERFMAVRQREALLRPQFPAPRLHLRYANHGAGLGLGLPALRAALRG